MSEPKLSGESITAEGLADLKTEIADLEGRARNEMSERIKVARDLGDLKENADYHIAKEDQAHLETKIKRLRMRLRDAVVVEADEGPGDVFAFGRTAEIADQDDNVRAWTLVGPTEADPSNGRLSAESPIGRGIRDRAVGESVVVETPAGKRTFTVKALID